MNGCRSIEQYGGINHISSEEGKEGVCVCVCVGVGGGGGTECSHTLELCLHASIIDSDAKERK